MKGFTLIELMIVVAIIAIIAAIAIPSLLQSKMAANEASAISALRTLSSSQELYKTRTGFYGDYNNLNNTAGGGTNKYIDPALAKADPDAAGCQAKSGYWVDISVNGTNTDWCAIAYPANWGKDGERNFFITSDGVIYYNPTSGDHATFTTVLGSS
jgi:type IV pilus assembly protein PilA